MSENAWMNPAAQFEAASRMWMSAWLQPWSVLQIWQEYWRDHWLGGLDALAAAPAPVPPVLVRESVAPFGRIGQDLAQLFTFFMPWLPRIEAVVNPEGAGDTVRVRLRATAQGPGASTQPESLLVDAKISFSSEPEGKTLEASAAPSLVEVPTTAEKAAPAPLPGPAGEARSTATKPKAAPRRRKAADQPPPGDEGKQP